MFIKQALLYGKNFLDNSDTAFLDTLIFLKEITGLSKEKILLDNNNNKLNNELEKKFINMLTKRKNHMPVQYIINHAEFMGLNFFVDQNVLIPRPDTEILVEQVLIHIKKILDLDLNLDLNQHNKSNKKNKIKVLDLCTGSGCIAIAIKKFCPDIFITALDISQAAINIAKKNAYINQVNINFICDDIFKYFNKDLAQNFDIIISNPPYISSNKINSLDKNIKDYEPILALDGGPDGLKFYKFIINNISHKTKIFFEIGFDQANLIKKILEQNDFIDINIIKDLSGLDRVIYAIKK